MEDFEARLAAAYQAWHESRGRTPDRFFSLYADDIELHSILEASLSDTMRGPFIGKHAAIAYFAAIAALLPTNGPRVLSLSEASRIECSSMSSA